MPITKIAHRLRSEEIKDLEVKTSDLASDAVTPDKSTLLYGTVDNQELREGTVSGAATDVLGTQSIDFTHSAFASAMDSALSILEGLTDTGAELDNIRIEEGSLTVSGATITYEVKTSGAAGSNAAFRFLSLGH